MQTALDVLFLNAPLLLLPETVLPKSEMQNKQSSNNVASPTVFLD